MLPTPLVFVPGLARAQTLNVSKRRHRELVVAYSEPLKAPSVLGTQ